MDKKGEEFLIQENLIYLILGVVGLTFLVYILLKMGGYL